MTSPSPSVPPRLYKYVTPDRLNVLQNECIRFTQPAALNDPWELKPNVDKIATDEQIESDILQPLFDDPDIQELLNDVVDSWETMPLAQRAKFPGGHPAFKKHMRRLEADPQLVARTLLQGRAIAEKGLKTASADFGAAFVQSLEEFGVLSLTINPSNKLMWSYYGPDHKGMVLEFDTSHAFFNHVLGDDGRVNHPRPVNYVAQLPTFLSLQDLTALGPKKAIEALMFTKENIWTHEEEWRMVNFLRSADTTISTDKDGKPLDHPIHLFNLPAPCITGVILGAQMPADKRQTIVDFVRTDPRYAHVSLSQAIIPARSSALEIEPLT